MEKLTKMQISKFSVIVAAVLTAVSVCLLILSFFTPPVGEINSSVLQGVSLILAFSVVWVVIIGIFRGSDVKLTHGQTNIEINNE